jgi:hypothetical protein
MSKQSLLKELLKTAPRAQLESIALAALDSVSESPQLKATLAQVRRRGRPVGSTSKKTTPPVVTVTPPKRTRVRNRKRPTPVAATPSVAPTAEPVSAAV